MSVAPGETVLTVMPRGPNSRAATLVNCSSAALLAQYSAMPGPGSTVLRLEMLMMRPPSRRSGSACRMASSGNFAFTIIARSNSSGVMSLIGAGAVIAALLTRMSRPSATGSNSTSMLRRVLLVGAHRDGVADLSGQRVGGGLVLAVAEHDPGAVRGEPPHDRPADAPGASRHHCGLAGERHGPGC